VGNWSDRQVQLSVLVPFHFLPGDDAESPWMTTRDSRRAHALLEAAGDDPLRLGIALHTLQDTFSHETFSGWQEDLNSCFPWYFVKSALPNVGHAELRVVPDVVNYVWTDPRDGRRVDNKCRAMAAARATFDFLAEFFDAGNATSVWAKLEPRLREVFALDSYDERKQRLRELSGSKTLRCSKLGERLTEQHGAAFIRAARAHLASAMKLFGDLPAPP